jgi:hypothetical protein
MPTPDASQYTQFRRYASVAGDALGSVGSKISPFNTSYTLPMLPASSQALFLPSANKETKFGPPAPVSSVDGPIWVSQIGNGSSEVSVYGITTDPNDGTLIVCGETNQVLFGGTVGNTFANKKAFVARYTTSGTFIDGETLGSGLTYVSAQSVTTDAHGNIYICGQTRENLDSGNEYDDQKGFCVKFSHIFELVWVLEQGSGLHSTLTTALMVSPDGYLYVAGNTLDTDWEDTEPHSAYEYRVAYVFVADPALGVILDGANYGSGSGGSTYITALSYVPIIGEMGSSDPFIAIAGDSQADLEFPEFGVSNPGGGGTYGFVVFTYFDLYPIAAFGIGSGDNSTSFSSMNLVTTPDITIVFLGGQTNEYLDGPDKDSLLAGEGNQGFVTGVALGGSGGFIGVTYIGDDQNYTAVTAISSNNQKFVIGGYTNENLDTGTAYEGMVLVNFTLELAFDDIGFSQLRQIGTGTSLQLLEDMASDTFGNFYVGGWSAERLPSGPSIPGTIGYIAKVSDQPKTYNTPIFFTQDTSYNAGTGQCILEYTPPLTIDWGDETVQNITTGATGIFNHTYSVSGIYNIVVDAKTGGEITVFRAIEAGVIKLDVSRCPTLLELSCDANFIANLNVSGCPNLQYLRCNDNVQLSSLDVSGLASLTNLITGSNAISTIHFEGCGLTDSTTATLEAAILDLSNDNDNPGRIYLDSNQETTYFGGDAADYFLTQLPDWTFIILP